MAKKRNAGQLSSLLRRSSVGGDGAEEGKLNTDGHAPAEDPYLVWFVLFTGFQYKVAQLYLE